MKNLLWDLAVIVRHAFDAGRSLGSFTDYEPPTKQLDRLTEALKGGETLTLALDISDAREAIDKARAEIDPAATAAFIILGNLGYVWNDDDAAWMGPVDHSTEGKRRRAVKQLESMGFKYDGGAIETKWEPPAGATWGGMLLALLKIRHMLASGPHMADTRSPGAHAFNVARLAVEGTERADARQHFETLLKVNELTRRAEGSSFADLCETVDEIRRLTQVM